MCWMYTLAKSKTSPPSPQKGYVLDTILNIIGWRGTMLSICSVGVGVSERQSEDSFVCFGVKPTQRAWARDFQRDRKKTRKSKVQEQSRKSDSQGKWPSERGWVSVPDSCVGISFGYTLARATECQKSAKISPFLRLGLTQVRACLFFLPLSLMYVISVEYL